MNFLFGKKQTPQAIAEVLEDGRAAANREMNKPKYKDYQGREPIIEILVRVQPENELSFEAEMKTGLTKTCLLSPGVQVKVKYETAKKDHVTIDDENHAILERNPQIIKK